MGHTIQRQRQSRFLSQLSFVAVTIAAITGVLLSTQGCAPMNGANPGASFGTTPALAITDGVPSPETVSFSKQHSYILVMKLLNGTGDGNATPPGGKTGTAQYQIRVIHNSDMTPVTKAAQLEVKYIHTSSKTDPTTAYDAGAAIQQPDGSFLVSVPLKGHGNWEIHTIVTESAGATSNQGDEHVLPITN